ncbi:MAG: hypothetical protein AVDCRST_MAG02-4492 [uncultured Rubrobacteraceae bacterium]|uniref:Uncharacterized protein n=1 Tax=uncultured Rubrobacteraceae bacterium TaxID=349277 RepID=A0A6J4RUA3_9ACTN|nr:MAG: hypothetical protein AVDCRST_MAG02-4492 [uncultured Rubrobacteraceae bacterium]
MTLASLERRPRGHLVYPTYSSGRYRMASAEMRSQASGYRHWVLGTRF